MILAQAVDVIANATKYKNALLKFITPNNVGTTGSHECGFYLPKAIHGIYTPHAPQKGSNFDHPVTIQWPELLQTQSMVKWYGRGTRSEYRLTGFGKNFPYLKPDQVGNVLVLIAVDLGNFLGYVLETDDDIQAVQDALSVDLSDSWALYSDKGFHLEPEGGTACIRRSIQAFADLIRGMPTGQEMSFEAQRILQECYSAFAKEEVDKRLLKCVHTEFDLFKTVEAKVWAPKINKQFETLNSFLEVAQSILQARKSRAGRSLENHAAFIFGQENLPFEVQPRLPGNPDMIFPSQSSYYSNPESTVVLGIKTTCRDRWRQVLNEAPAISKKYILTLQPAITRPQLEEMHSANVTLVVPASLHKDYPNDSAIELLSVRTFVQRVKETVPGNWQMF